MKSFLSLEKISSLFPCRVKGFRAFVVIWVGQLLSLLGTGLTSFALTIWTWEASQRATYIALIECFSFAPVVIFSPVAGVLVDRWNRKFVMLLADLASGCITIVLLLINYFHTLQIWHLFIAKMLVGSFFAFQLPAYLSTISLLVEKKDYSRASGMMSMAQSASGFFSPMIAPLLLPWLKLSGILFIDIVTCAIATLSLTVIVIPVYKKKNNITGNKYRFWKDMLYGFQYILRKKGFSKLQFILFFNNLFCMFGILSPALILARSGVGKIDLARVQVFGAAGGIIGSLLVSLFSGEKYKIERVLIGMVLSSLLGQVLLGFGKSIILWSTASFFSSFLFPLRFSANQALWQSRIPPDLQGRVFSARRIMTEIAGVITMLIAGPIADFIFEPAMLPGGFLEPVFGWMVGSGKGSGISLLLIFVGMLGIATGVIGYMVPAIRNIEKLHPSWK